MNEFHAIIRGRVQLVMFRDFTTRTARKIGIKGSVRNCPDGSVEVIAQGEKTKLDTFLGALRRGSLLSRVESIESMWRVPTTQFDGFHIVY